MPIAQRFGDVGFFHTVFPCEVGDGAGDFADAFIGACGEAEAFDCAGQQCFACIVEAAICFDLA